MACDFLVSVGSIVRCTICCLCVAGTCVRHGEMYDLLPVICRYLCEAWQDKRFVACDLLVSVWGIVRCTICCLWFAGICVRHGKMYDLLPVCCWYLCEAWQEVGFVACDLQIPANHRQQIAHLTMPHTDISKYRQQILHLTMPHTGASNTPARNRTSYHASHRHQQITGNKSYILPWPQTDNKQQITSWQQVVHLTMPHTDTSKSQATNRTSYHASHRYQQITGNKSYILPCLTQIPANHRHQVVLLTMLHTGTSKS